MALSNAHIDSAGNHCLRASVSVPFVVSGVNVSAGKFTSVASSGWSFEQSQTPFRSGHVDLSVYSGSPIWGVLIVEDPNKLNSIRYLTDLGYPKYKLAEVLTVAVEKSGDQFIAIEPRRGWYGYGDTEDRAIGNFASSLVEELEGLAAREGHLSQHLRVELLQLRRVVIPRR